MTRFGRTAAVVISGVTLGAGLLFDTGAASASPAGNPAAGNPAASVAAAKHYYVKGRLGSFNIRANHTTSSSKLETVKAGQGAWCWNQTSDCGAATKGGSYRCSSTTPSYDDWLPVATSSGQKGWVARHCVYAVYQ